LDIVIEETRINGWWDPSSLSSASNSITIGGGGGGGDGDGTVVASELAVVVELYFILD